MTACNNHLSVSVWWNYDLPFEKKSLSSISFWIVILLLMCASLCFYFLSLFTVLFVARAFSYFVVRTCLYHCVHGSYKNFSKRIQGLFKGIWHFIMDYFPIFLFGAAVWLFWWRAVWNVQHLAGITIPYKNLCNSAASACSFLYEKYGIL